MNAKKLTAVLAVVLASGALFTFTVLAASTEPAPAAKPTTATAIAAVEAENAPLQREAAAICPVEGCLQQEPHEHNGVAYLAHHSGDGHKYHNETCPVENCTEPGAHEHDGTLYGAHNNGDGHEYHGQNHNENHQGGHH